MCGSRFPARPARPFAAWRDARVFHPRAAAFPRLRIWREPPIGRRTTDLETGLGSSLLPPMTCLHKGHHLLFGRASLLRFHRSLLAPALFTKRRSSPCLLGTLEVAVTTFW